MVEWRAVSEDECGQVSKGEGGENFQVTRSCRCTDLLVFEGEICTQ